MAQTKKELRLDMPLAEWLEQYTKEELIDIAQLISMGQPDPDAKKSRIVGNVASYMLNSMDMIIDIMSVFELEFLRKLLLPENRYGLVSRNMDAVLPLTKTGIIISAPHPLGKDYAVYLMLDEVKERVRLYVDLEWQNKKQHGYHRLEQLALGVLNLLGGMKSQDWFDHVERYMDVGDKMLWKDFQNYLLNNTLFAGRRIWHISPAGKPDCFFASPYITNDTEQQQLFNDVIWDRPNHNYVKFDKQQVMDYGQLPFPHVTSPSFNTLRDMMVNKAEQPLSEEETDFILYRLWITRQLNRHEENIDIMTWMWEKVKFRDEKDADRLADATGITFHDMPLWHLDGKSTDDLLKPRTAVEIQMPMVPLTNKKVGRNDPCPCGSGKKFKHCCGK